MTRALYATRARTSSHRQHLTDRDRRICTHPPTSARPIVSVCTPPSLSLLVQLPDQPTNQHLHPLHFINHQTTIVHLTQSIEPMVRERAEFGRDPGGDLARLRLAMPVSTVSLARSSDEGTTGPDGVHPRRGDHEIGSTSRLTLTEARPAG